MYKQNKKVMSSEYGNEMRHELNKNRQKTSRRETGGSMLSHQGSCETQTIIQSSRNETVCQTFSRGFLKFIFSQEGFYKIQNSNRI